MNVKIAKQVQDQLAKPKDHLKTPKTKSKKGNPLSAEQKEVVDRLVTLTDILAASKPIAKEAEELKTQLRALADELFPADQVAILQGEFGRVEFSPASDQRTIEDMNGLIGKLKEKVGYEGLVAILKLTLTDVDKYLSASESAAFLGKKTGSRSLKSASHQ